MLCVFTYIQRANEQENRVCYTHATHYRFSSELSLSRSLPNTSRSLAPASLHILPFYMKVWIFQRHFSHLSVLNHAYIQYLHIWAHEITKQNGIHTNDTKRTEPGESKAAATAAAEKKSARRHKKNEISLNKYRLRRHISRALSACHRYSRFGEGEKWREGIIQR